jgi:hypothetical protein
MDTSTTTTRGRGGTPIDRTNCTATRHGNDSAYRQGCRCDDAREDKRIYRKRLREGRHKPKVVNGAGTARRLQALGALGWPSAVLGARLGVTDMAVRHYRQGRQVTRRTADQVARLYEQLSGTGGPSAYTRSRARSYGWVPPLLWEEIDMDDPNAQPEEETLATGRRTAAVLVEDFDYLVSTGMSKELAAARLGIEADSIGNARRRVKVSAARRAQIARKQEAA